MNLRCSYCQTPFTLSRMEKLAAIQHLQAENLHHYDAICPRCRRSTPVSLDRLRVFTPGWQEGLQTLEADAAANEKEMAAASVSSVNQGKSASEIMPAAPAKKHHHASKTVVKKPVSAKSAKASATKPVKKAAVKPSASKKTTKPAASTAPKTAAKKTSKPTAKVKSK